MKTTKNQITQHIPDSYSHYEKLFFCNNTFINLNQIVNDNGFIPLLIGKGEFPRIWLYAKNVNNPVALVRDNISFLSQVKVNFYQIEKRMSIEIFNMKNDYIKILEIKSTDNTPNITHLDLRPIGYNIYGDENSLNIGERKFVNNVFQGMHTLIKIEKNNSKKQTPNR